MLFDMKKRQEFPSIDIIRQLINFASDNNFLYADQDVLNLLDIIDCSLPLKFNCFRWLAARVNDVKIIHYTAEVGVKKLFDKFISEQG